ncbi:MAG TPA: hypothetical protein VFY18_03460 [Candidatus Limnocylindrales bacterium]|nr:hypothetical protein [Candidatus Limnocylindrales bacterium]
MPEILTESFCERCGTRYTFESAAPRKTRRLGQFKTLSKGLKNYVLSDDTSMDEAMASARSDEERETTAQQLDAFHATFNFCMNCRQYTCSNCWNQAEGRCLTCAPNLGRDILGAHFPDDAPFAPDYVTAEAWPTADLASLEAADPAMSQNGTADLPSWAVPAEPTNGVVHDHGPAEEDDPGAHFSFLTTDHAAAEAGADASPAPEEPVAEAAAATAPETEWPEADAEVAATAPELEWTAAEVAATAPEVDWAEAEAAAIEEYAPDDSLAPGADAGAADSVAAVASTLASNTSELFGRFRPGQNIDAELAAFEAELDSAQPVAAEVVEPDGTAEPEPVWAANELETEPSVAAAWPEPDPEIVAAAWPDPEREIGAAGWPEALEPDREVAAAPEPPVFEPEPEPVAAEPEPIAAEPEPVAAEPEPIAAEPARTDRIEQPTWRIFAPDQTTPAGGQPGEAPVTPPGLPPVAASDPQWPTRPDVPDSPSMALLANRTRASSDALWAASTREILSPAAADTAASASVQPCSSCGLSLSATARFCRRCGTRQG